MSKQSPGPWVSVSDPDDCGQAPEHRVTQSNTHDWPMPVAEVYTEADARLIAAAPDLLEALTFFVNHPGVSQLCTPNSDVMTAARAAIARATGEQV